MIDFSNFFLTYNPITNRLKTNRSPSWNDLNQTVYNNYSDINLGIDTSTYRPTSDDSNSNLWDSLGWGQKLELTETTEQPTTEQTTVDLTTELTTTSNTPAANTSLTVNQFDGTHYTFVKLVAPVVKANLITANSKFNLGLSNTLIEQNTRRITLQFLMESGKGVSAVSKNNNNLGGLKYSDWEAKYGGSKSSKNSFTVFKSLDGFFLAYFGGPDSLYIKRNRDVLYATSDRDYVERLRRLKYFGNESADRYFNLVFNKASINAWNKYAGNE